MISPLHWDAGLCRSSPRLLRAFLLLIVLVLLNATSSATTVSLPDPEQQLQLEIAGVLSAEQTDAMAVLMPLRHTVKIANRLIVVAREELTFDDFPAEYKTALNSVELLHHYQDRFIHIAKLDTVAHALGLNTSLQQHPKVFYAQPDLLPLRARLDNQNSLQNTLHINAQNFNVAQYLRLDSVWKETKGRGVHIAVIDVGFSLGHPSLKKIKLRHAWDVDMNVPDAMSDAPQRHGNKVVGVIWAQPQLLHEVAEFSPGHAWGIAPEAELIALKLQRPWSSNLLRAFAEAERQKADVINASWLIPWVATPVREYLRYLTTEANHKKGIVIVAAAAPTFQPNQGLAAMPELLVVSSTDHRGTLANSSWDPFVDIAAASYVLTVSQIAGRDYEMFAKTSSSAALVSGWVALLRAVRPDMTATQLQSLLAETGAKANQPMPAGPSFDYTVFDAEKAYARLKKM